MKDSSSIKLELLASLLAREGIEFSQGISKRKTSGAAPLSFAQQRLWFMEQLDPGSAIYNCPRVVRLEGRLDPDTLERVINEIVRRHEALRTRFEVEEGVPMQVIDPCEPWRLEVVDLTSLPQDKREKEVGGRVRKEAITGFDLSRGPLLRVKVLKLQEEDHVVLFTTHHIVSDAWSMEILIREVSTLYQALIVGEPSPLAELPIQYADFAVWQRERLQGKVLEEELRYWRERLAGMEDLELPIDHPRPAAPSYRGSGRGFVVEGEVAAKLKELCPGEGVTLFMTLLAGFDVLMSRYSGQTDVAIGTDIANRNRAETEGLIGFFVNQLVMRVEVRPRENFHELLKRVKEVCLGAYAHQDLPFEKLVEELKPERNLSKAPLFNAKLIMQNAPVERLGMGGVRLVSGQVGEVGAADGAQTARFDLTVLIIDEGYDLVVDVSYSRDLFEEETIERLIRHYTNVLRGIVEESERPISELNLLGAEERRQILVEWNETGKSYSPDLWVHELFEEQAERSPERIALIGAGQALSYGELNRRANQLGNYLQGLGVGPDVVVGLCLERSLEMVAALLGTLKAGGAYLPLDPDYPLERLSFMLEDAGVGVVLAERKTEGRLPTFWGQTVCLDVEWERISRQSDVEPASEVDEGNLAYVIYTSGSTGKPKGVMVAHRGVCNLVEAQKEIFGIGADSRVLQFASLSFDASVWEIFSALAAGGSLHVYGRESLRPGDDLPRVLREDQITMVTLPPTALAMLSEEGLFHLQSVISAGEACTSEIAECWVRGRRFFNAYGPTEATVCASIGEFESGSDGKPTIGRPIINTRLYILDREMRPAPVGVKGEFYISGMGLARGYLMRAEQTAERFVPNPFGAEVGERCYRSGDLCRYMPDGRIEFVGRDDWQVKIRGFRIELGEIEARLADYPGINEAVVIAEENGIESKKLVAYYTGEKLGVEVLRGRLLSELPDYMAPAAYVHLEKLPLTPNGKLDRRALPTPDVRDAEEVDGYLAPRTAVEEIMIGILEEVLKVDGVGRKDNFFELGGHSLLATQVVSRVRTMLGVEIGVRSVFEKPTVEGLASKIEEALRYGKKDEAPPLVRVSREERLPLSFAQQRLWFLDQLKPGSAIYNIPEAIRLEDSLNLGALERSVNEIVRRHEVLRTRIVMESGEPAQVIDAWEPRRLEFVDLTSLSKEEKKEEVSRRAKEEEETGFDLSRGPLLRVKVLQLEEEEWLVIYTMHHIVSDGWSMGILIKEVETLYQAYSAGESSPLPELEIQYADYAVWQRAYLAGEVLDREVGYWKEQLKDAAVLELPADRPRPVEPSYRGAAEIIDMGRSLSEGLRRLSRREGVTLFMTLMAAFKVLLMRYSGQDDIVVGTAIANRTRKEAEGLIGFFVNTLVMRTDLSGNPSFRELVRREREVALGAYTHQEVPFEKLVEELNPARDLSRSPLFQVMMLLQNADGGTLELPEVKLSGGGAKVGPGSETKTARFDLTLSMTDLGHELGGSVEYSRDLFEAGTIERLINHYTNVLEGVVKDSERPIWSLDLLREEERKQIVEEWNATEADYPAEKLIHQLFEEQADRAPDGIAGENGDVAISYGELNRRANQLGNYLRRQGVGVESRVGICLERGVEMLVSLLGIMKSGGTYVPLDPSYPAERLKFMREDSAVRPIVTQEKIGRLLGSTTAELIRIDSNCDEIAREDDENINSGVESENLAYVIYTSGSTGRPKGTMITHRSVVNLVTDAVRKFRLESDSKFLQFASLSFDVSVEEIYPAWSIGGGVVLRPDEVSYSYSELEKTIERHEVTTIELPTVYWREWAHEMSKNGRRAPRSLDLVIIAGERVSPEILKEWKGQDVSLLHVYGVTEATVTSTAYLAPGDLADRAGLAEIPIGAPMANMEVYLLDGDLHPMPVGISSELYLGGAGVACGYLNRPELTAEKFVPSPFGKRAGMRLYKSGDLARYSTEGHLEFVGRIDHQVKIRGFRVELGEIETALDEHELVKKSVVIASEDERGGRRLIGYAVASEGATESSLKKHVRERLPEHMVPEAILLLDEIPLTANGKIDRKNLLSVASLRNVDRRMEHEYVDARTPLEEMVVGIFGEVLRLDRVGIYDNFFDVGGHSLLAIQVISRVRDAFEVEIDMRDVFDAPTAEGLSRKIEEAMRAGEKIETPPLVRIGREGDRARRAPLSFAQQRLWFIEQLEPGNAAYNIPDGVRLEGKLDLNALESAINEIVRRHEVLRTRIEEEGSEPAQVIDEWKPRKLDVEDLTVVPPEKREEEVGRRMMEEARTGFDLKRGPLLRVKVLKLAEEEHVALYTMHHIVSDVWSTAVLMKEVGALYNAITEGKESPLPELKIQYADYAYWQRSYLSGEVLEMYLQYWKRRLGGKLPVIELPSDRPRPQVFSYRGAAISSLLPTKLSESLRGMSRREGVTLSMVLLAAFKTLLNKYTAQEDVIVGVPWLNRDRIEIEPLIGFFVNMLPLRTDLSGNPRFRELLMRVKDVALGAFAHQEAPFEKLVEEIRPERKLKQTPLYNVVFTLQNERKQEKEEEKTHLNGLKISPVGVGRQSAKVDLWLGITEIQGALEAGWVYSADLFEEETIVRMHGHFETLLFSIVARPDAPIDELEILTEAERSQQSINQSARRKFNYSRFKSVKPKAIPLSEG